MLLHDRSTDPHLLQRAAAGHRDAFERLYHAHVEAVHDHVLRLTRDPVLAAAVTHEAFAALVHDPAQVPDDMDVRVWLLREARRRRPDALRRRTEAPPRLDVLSDREAIASGVALDAAGVRLTTARTADAARLVWQVTAALRPSAFSVLDLHLRQGLRVGQIGEVLDMDRPSVVAAIADAYGRWERRVVGTSLAATASGSCPDLPASVVAAGTVLTLAESIDMLEHAEDCSSCGADRPVVPGPVYEALDVVGPSVRVHAAVYAAADAGFASDVPTGGAGAPRFDALQIGGIALIVLAVLLFLFGLPG